MKGECRKLTLSPDNQKMSLDCFDNGAYDIYLLKKNSNSFEKITNCKENHQMCSSSPGWSPDGRWFAYYREDEIGSGIREDSFKGFYIFNSDCLNDNSCMEKQIGPILDHGLQWSKNNELMSYADKSLRFHEFNNGVLSPTNRVVKIDVGNNPEDLYNSPDGQYFAYADKFAAKRGSLIVYFVAHIAEDLINNFCCRLLSLPGRQIIKIDGLVDFSYCHRYGRKDAPVFLLS